MEYLATVLIKIISTDVDASLSLSNACITEEDSEAEKFSFSLRSSENSRGRTYSREVWLQELGDIIIMLHGVSEIPILGQPLLPILLYTFATMPLGTAL